MSMKANKNGKEYPIGVIPQNVIDDVEELKATVGKASSYTFVPSDTASPTIPNISQYKNITFALQIPNTTRLFNIYTLPTDSFKQNRFWINTIWQSGSVEIGYSSDTTLSINWDNWSGIGWGLAVILSN